MATLTIEQINDHLAQAYLNASEAQRQQIKRVLEEILLLMTGTPHQTPQERRLLQKGQLKPLKPFQAVMMKGEGPSATEMVIRGRD